MQGFSGNSCFLRMAMWRLNLSESGWGVGEAKHVMSSDVVQMPLQARCSLPRTPLRLLLRTATDTSALTRKQEQPASLLQSRQEQDASLLPCTGEGTAKRRARVLAPGVSPAARSHRWYRRRHAADQQHAASHRHPQRITHCETAVFQPAPGQPQLGHRATDDILGTPHVVVLVAHGDPLWNAEAGLAQGRGRRQRWIHRWLSVGHAGGRAVLGSGACHNRSTGRRCSACTGGCFGTGHIELLVR